MAYTLFYLILTTLSDRAIIKKMTYFYYNFTDKEFKVMKVICSHMVSRWQSQKLHSDLSPEPEPSFTNIWGYTVNFVNSS